MLIPINRVKIHLLVILSIMCFVFGESQSTLNQIFDLKSNIWPAKWLSYEGLEGDEFAVLHFRKNFTLEQNAEEFIIHISADNRYKLYVNGEYITYGPARGDEMHWPYETLDIAAYLREGENTIAVVVWNFGQHAPLAQHTARTGLIVQGNSPLEAIINTDKSWKVFKSRAYQPIPVRLNAYYVVGPGERFDGNKHPWNWEKNQFNDGKWETPKEMDNGRTENSFRQYGNVPDHILVKRAIPLMEEFDQQFKSIRKSSVNSNIDKLPNKSNPITIPANARHTILLDQGFLTNAYPILNYSNGRDAEIKMTYAESLFINDNEKGNRNDVEGKFIKGNSDIILSNGIDDQIYETLWWRTFRYIELQITTTDEPLIIHEVYSRFTGYPLVSKASFKSDYELTDTIWEIGWRTQRLCTVETFFDCPYYEQLQYAGDTRIQSLIAFHVAGDTIMMRNAIKSLNESRLPSGLTQSRYPSRDMQLIPTFSLVWITMIHDYWMRCEDDVFIRDLLPGVADVLQWFDQRMASNGMLGDLEWWNFVDWVTADQWEAGIPPRDGNGQSAILSLQYLYTLQKAIELFDNYGLNDHADAYRKSEQEIKNAILKFCQDPDSKMLYDTPDKKTMSEHANILGILTNTIPKDLQMKVYQAMAQSDHLAKATYYFKFYYAEMLRHLDMGQQYLEMLKPWEEMVDLGLTTFAEKPEPSRSDCHAWSASPLYFFITLVAGIETDAIGFKKVKIEPNFGSLTTIKASMPYRSEHITLDLEKTPTGEVKGTITLPTSLFGSFVTKNGRLELSGGINKINL